MKKRLIILPIVVVCSWFLLTSNRNGPAGSSGSDASGARGGAGCNNGSGCHGSPSSLINMTITLDSAGVPVRHYIAGITYNVTVTGINNSTDSLPAGGFTLTVVNNAGSGTASATNAGTLASTGLPSGCVNRTLSSGLNLIEHNDRIGPYVGSGRFGTGFRRSIAWTAPSSGTGTVRLYGAVNAVNVDSRASGDRWNWVNDTIVELRPSVLPIRGAGSVCAGASLALSSGSAGGTWVSSNAAIATVSSSGVVSGVSAGVAMISYSTSSLGYDTALVTVLPATNPGTIYGGTSVCGGTSYTLRSTVSGGIWSTTAASVASVDPSTGLVRGISRGTATISYRVSGVCGAAFAANPMSVDTFTVAGTMTGPAAACIGASSLVMRTTGSGGGSWSTASTSVATIDTMGMLRGIASGDAIITYTVTNACGTATLTDTFTILPNPPAIGGPNHVCEGNTITLTNAVTGGIWRTRDPSVTFTAAGFGTVTGIRPGLDTVSYTAPTGCVVTMPIRVDTTPAAITGTLSLCQGVRTTLSNATPGGRWSSANATTATISTTGEVTGVNTNTTTISYTIPSTGCFASASVTVYPLPSFIQGSATFCAGGTDSLWSLTAGGVWSSGATSIATIDPSRGMLYGVTGGTVTVQYTMPLTGCFVTRSFVVRPQPIPVVSYNGGTNTFSTANYYTRYQWYRDGGIIGGATSNTVGGPYDGSYTVFVIDTFGCANMSAPYVLVNVGVSNIDFESLHVYPNPVGNELMIDAPVSITATITSMDGRLLISSTDAHRINVSELASGMYLLHIADDAGLKIGVQKFIKK
jgi:uncharacterized protein YjdB